MLFRSDRRLLAENQRLFTEFKDVVAAVVALSWDYEQENAILKVAEKQPLADALSGQFAKHKLHNEALGKREAEAAAAAERRELELKLQAERAQATRLAQQKASEAARQACLDQRSRLDKLASVAGLGDSCAPR